MRRIPDRRDGKEDSFDRERLLGGGFGEENAAKIDEEDKSGRRMVYVPCIGIGKGGDFPKPIFPINHHVHDVLYWRFQRGDRDFSE